MTHSQGCNWPHGGKCDCGLAENADRIAAFEAELARVQARNAKLEEFAAASVAQSKFSCPHY